MDSFSVTESTMVEMGPDEQVSLYGSRNFRIPTTNLSHALADLEKVWREVLWHSDATPFGSNASFWLMIASVIKDLCLPSALGKLPCLPQRFTLTAAEACSQAFRNLLLECLEAEEPGFDFESAGI
ncbi:hypothetical protein OAL43_01325 [bacterium]|nr:hypothetical protein [Rhodopirellula sp.]MDB4679084.1 hypothetical protein [Rhodopirellula sp.]MDC0278825.1 hypothetical protein [bacterium]